MKKIGILFLFVSTVLFGQSDMLNIGIGIGNGSFAIYSGSNGLGGYKSRVSLPAVGVSYETWVHESITLGAYISYNTTVFKNDDWVYNKKSYRNIWAGARAAYYFDELIGLEDDFDLLAGVSLGFGSASVRETSNLGAETIKNSSFWFPVAGVFIGGRYHLSDRVAIFSELGVVASWLTIGATVRL